MTGRYVRKPMPLEVRGVSRSSYPPLEKAEDPTPAGFPIDTYSTHGFTISNASNSGRSSPSNVDSELGYSFVSNSWTTGNTTERSSIYSLGEDEFDRAASKKVWELFKQIDSMLFENRDGPLLLNGECQEWVSRFPHLRILGKQKIPPQDMGYQLVPNENPLPLSGNLLTDVTEQDLSGTMGQLSIMGHHLDALKPLMDGSSSYLEEEVFEQDGHLEDIIGIDYQSADDDAKTNVTQLKHSGMPPVTPQACVKDNITGAAFDFIWAEFISWLRPLLGRYARQLLTDDGEELEDVHMPPLGMPLIDGPTFSLTRDMFPLSREASLLSTSRIPDKRTGMNRLEDLLTISTKTLLKRDKSNLHETVDLQTTATLHPRPVSSNTKYLSGSRPLSVKPLEQHRHASARAKTSGRRLLAPIAGDRARTPNAEEEKNQRLQNEVIRGHRLTTMNDQITSPPPQFGRNGTLPPLDSGEMNGIAGRRTINNRVGSAAFHDKESLMHVLRERPALPLETRPSTTHMLYRTDIQSGRRSSTPMGFNNSFKLSSVATTGNVTGPHGQQLNVTGSSINPHGGPDIEIGDNFEDIVQSSAQWECPHSTATPVTPHRRLTQHNVIKHLTGGSALPAPVRKGRLHQHYHMPVR